MIQHLKLQQNFRHFVIIPYNTLAIVSLQDFRVFLQMFHRFLNSSEHLASPHDLASDWRKIPSNGRLVTKSLVGFLNVLNVSTELEQYLVVFVCNCFFKTLQAQSRNETTIRFFFNKSNSILISLSVRKIFCILYNRKKRASLLYSTKHHIGFLWTIPLPPITIHYTNNGEKFRFHTDVQWFYDKIITFQIFSSLAKLVVLRKLCCNMHR